MNQRRNMQSTATRIGWVRRHPLFPDVWNATTALGDVLRDELGAPRSFSSEADAVAALQAARAERLAEHRRQRRDTIGRP